MSAYLLDPKRNGKFPFEYRNSVNTNVAETFERIRREREAAEQQPNVRSFTSTRARKT